MSVTVPVTTGQVGVPELSLNPAITFFVVLFGTLWLLTNLYAFYPLVQTAVEGSLVGRSSDDHPPHRQPHAEPGETMAHTRGCGGAGRPVPVVRSRRAEPLD